MKNILAKFVLPAVVLPGIRNDDYASIDYLTSENQVADENLVVGFTTRQKLLRLLEEGDICTSDIRCFYSSVRHFLMKATQYLIKWCPLNDPLLHHANWIDFRNRQMCSLVSVEYFVGLYDHILGSIDHEKLTEQFLNYQLILDEDIPDHIKSVCSIDSGGSFSNIDQFWGYLMTIK